MELDYYLFKSKQKQKDFAQRCGVGVSQLSAIVNRRKTPSLYTAMKIYFASDEQVDLFSMLEDRQKEQLNKKYRILKKENVYHKEDARFRD